MSVDTVRVNGNFGAGIGRSLGSDSPLVAGVPQKIIEIGLEATRDAFGVLLE